VFETWTFMEGAHSRPVKVRTLLRGRCDGGQPDRLPKGSHELIGMNGRSCDGAVGDEEHGRTLWAQDALERTKALGELAAPALHSFARPERR
jgi:hypothetical protein